MKFVLSKIIGCKHGTFLIILQFSIRISPNDQNPEAALDRCSTKVVIVLKNSDTNSSFTSVVKRFEKKLTIAMRRNFSKSLTAVAKRYIKKCISATAFEDNI